MDRRPTCEGPAAGPALRPPSPRTDDGGSQSLELALAVPGVMLLAAVVLAAGQAALALLATQQTAGLAARLAATRADAAVLDAVADAIGDTDLRLELDPPSPGRRPGDLVTATAVREVELLGLGGRTVTVRARAIALTEDVEP